MGAGLLPPTIVFNWVFFAFEPIVVYFLNKLRQILHAPIWCVRVMYHRSQDWSITGSREELTLQLQ